MNNILNDRCEASGPQILGQELGNVAFSRTAKQMLEALGCTYTFARDQKSQADSIVIWRTSGYGRIAHI